MKIVDWLTDWRVIFSLCCFVAVFGVLRDYDYEPHRYTVVTELGTFHGLHYSWVESNSFVDSEGRRYHFNGTYIIIREKEE